MTDNALYSSGKEIGTVIGIILGLVLAFSFLCIISLRHLFVRHWRKKHSDTVTGHVVRCETSDSFTGTQRYLLTIEYNDNSGVLETAKLISFSPDAPQLKEVELSIVSYADRMRRYGEEYTVKPDFEELKQFPELSNDEKEAMKRKFENYLAAEHPNHAASFADGFFRPFLCAQKAEFADKKAHKRPHYNIFSVINPFILAAAILTLMFIAAAAIIGLLMSQKEH